MKRVAFVFVAIFVCLLSSFGPDTGSSTTRAGIIAEDFVNIY